MFVFFLLSVKYKLDNSPAVRPLYIYGLVAIGILYVLKFSRSVRHKNINLLVLNQIPLYCLLAILTLFFASSFLAPARVFKDFLYFAYWFIVLPLLLASYVNDKYSVPELLFLLCKSVVIFAVLSAITAILTFFGILEYEYGSYVLKQNLWTATRLHGYMGEPTALGGLLGFSVIAFSYMKATKSVHYGLLIYAFLLVSIIGAGSRNTMLCLAVVGLLGILIEVTKSQVGIFIVGCLIAVVLVVVLLFGKDVFIEAIARPAEISVTNQGNRLLIWERLIGMYANGEIVNLLFGFGAGSFSRETGGFAAFNASLEILYAHGILGFVLYQLLFITSFYVGIKRYRLTGCLVYKFGVLFVVYGYCFSLFMSFFPATNFNFPAFAFVFGILLTCIPIKTLSASKSQDSKDFNLRY